MAEDKNTRDMTDVALVQGALEHGERFGFIIERYKEPLRRYVRRIARPSADELEMLLQDIFIKTYENLNDFDQDMSFSSWIYRIAHNESVDFHRKKKRWGGSLDQPSGDEEGLSLAETIAAEEDFTIESDSSYTKACIASVLDEMDPKYRSVLVLKFLEGKDYQDISDILRKPPGTIATLIHRAKREFRRLLESKGIRSEDL